MIRLTFDTKRQCSRWLVATVQRMHPGACIGPLDLPGRGAVYFAGGAYLALAIDNVAGQITWTRPTVSELYQSLDVERALRRNLTGGT